MHALTVSQVRFNVSESAMTELFLLFQAVCPIGNTVPNFKAAKRLMEQRFPPVGLRVFVASLMCFAVMYDACVNDCRLYNREHDKRTHCPRCGSARFDGRGVAVKVFRYIPLLPQLLALYRNERTFKWLHWLHQHAATEGVISDITEAPGFLAFLRANGVHNLLNTLILNLTCDGINPFAGSVFTVWPIALSVLNYSPNIRTRVENLLLCGIVPGPGAPKRINTYLEPLIDEFVHSGFGGAAALDPTNSPFTLRFLLLGFLSDYQALAKVTCIKGSGSKCGCIKCEIRGVGESNDVSKIVYDRCRRYLVVDHHWRDDSKHFGSVERASAPALRLHQDVVVAAETARNSELEFGTATKSSLHPGRTTGVTNYCQLLRVPNRDLVSLSLLDLMHIVVRCCL